MPADLSGQWPGEIFGRVTDEVSGRPIPAAELHLLPEALGAVTSADGSFHFRGLEPGHHVLRIAAFGYAPSSREVEVRNGVVLDVDFALGPVALAIEGVDASVAPSLAGAVTLGAERLRSTPGNTVADVLRSVPGVLIVSSGSGGAQTPTMRGSGADAVLVLVDGVPLNDPITGEADLSALPISGIESVTVLPGGQSARYGARAAAGAILVRTGSPGRGLTVAGGMGSLDERYGEATGERSGLGGRLDAVGTYRAREGGFEFEVPPEFGGGSSRVSNADSRSWSGRVGWTGENSRGRSTVGVSAEHVARGLPGRSFAPSPEARQSLTQARLFGSVNRDGSAGGTVRTSGYLHYYRSTFSDPKPPFGQAYEDRTTLVGGGGDGTYTRAFGLGVLTMGVAAKHARIHSTVLSTVDPPTRTDIGAWVSASFPNGPLGTAWTGAVRVDHSGLPSAWFGSHDIRVERAFGVLTINAGHRSSFSPPTLGDQFFREGVGIEPNPDLRAERVPSEWVGGVAIKTRVEGLLLSLDAETYSGDTKDMIVWLPDFRFVWSPRNQDVLRRGLDLRGRVRSPASGVELWAGWSYNRATYDRENSKDVQVAYRPRYQSGIGASLTRSVWSLLVDARYTGARFPVPNDVNELAAFWALDLSARRSLVVGSAAVEIQLQVERLLDQHDALIFAFPHPGRALRVTVRLGRITTS